MIRDFLGHLDVKTTQIYARTNLEMQRTTLEKISDPSPVRTIPSCQQNRNLLDWLHYVEPIHMLRLPGTKLDTSLHISAVRT
jgi:hypothetical protein